MSVIFISRLFILFFDFLITTTSQFTQDFALYQFNYLHEYKYQFSLKTAMFSTNYKNLQNTIIHDYSYDLNFYKLISDYLSKSIDIHMIDVKFISIKQTFIYFLSEKQY